MKITGKTKRTKLIAIIASAAVVVTAVAVTLAIVLSNKGEPQPLTAPEVRLSIWRAPIGPRPIRPIFSFLSLMAFFLKFKIIFRVVVADV